MTIEYSGRRKCPENLGESILHTKPLKLPSKRLPYVEQVGNMLWVLRDHCIILCFTLCLGKGGEFSFVVVVKESSAIVWSIFFFKFYTLFWKEERDHTHTQTHIHCWFPSHMSATTRAVPNQSQKSEPDDPIHEPSLLSPRMPTGRKQKFETEQDLKLRSSDNGVQVS